MTAWIIASALVFTFVGIVWIAWEIKSAPLVPDFHPWSDEARPDYHFPGAPPVYTGFRGGSRMDGPLLSEPKLDPKWKAPDTFPEDWS